jgi:hypothetical protein
MQMRVALAVRLREIPTKFTPKNSYRNAGIPHIKYVFLTVKLGWCGRPDLNRHGKLLPRDFKYNAL